MITAVNSAKKSVTSLQTAVNQLQQSGGASVDLSSIQSQIDALQTSISQISQSASSSSSGDSNDAAITAIETQLDALVDYLQSWVNTGNLTMSDIRNSVGQPLSS